MPNAARRGSSTRSAKEEGIERIEGPHCYAFYSGNEAFDKIREDEFSAFYLTDLIARQFEAFIIEPLKLDKHPELAKMVFGNYTKIVYLAQTEDPACRPRQNGLPTISGSTMNTASPATGELSVTAPIDR
jgi:hypothetical protein